ncbi:MAG: glutathione peroxidase [Halioglobus sp.]|nr:glutathione peroxidase [Halioglobus sp.]
MFRFIFPVLLALYVNAAHACPEFLDHDVRKLHSQDTVNLCEVASGKPLLIVNTASHCGYTSQFTGLEELHEAYKDKGLVVVGFASNDFRQEASDESEAAAICYKNYGVTFTMMAPSSVRGEGANPVFTELARQSGAPSWNFNKYLVDANGEVVEHFGSNTKPQSSALVAAIEQAVTPLP